MDQDPYKPPTEEEPTAAPAPKEVSISGGKAAYNVVTDVVTGPNLRGKDNIFQAKCIGIAIAVCAGLGAIGNVFVIDPDMPWFALPITGAVIGLILGASGSGLYLMIYRGARHLTGKHD